MRHIALACSLAFLIAVSSSCGSETVDTVGTDDTEVDDTTVDGTDAASPEISEAAEPTSTVVDDSEDASSTTAPDDDDSGDAISVPPTETTDGPAPTDAPTTTESPATTADGSDTAGTVNVSLEPVRGIFIEGFEVGLRFETADGTTIDSMLWNDFVQSADNATPGDFYKSVLHQQVPAGSIVVLATANIGLGPAPVVPDVAGKLNCRLVVDVPAGGEVDVEVAFDATNCLSLK